MALWMGLTMDCFYSYDWACYEERVVQFLIANDVPAEKQVAVFIVAIGRDTYNTLRQLCHPDVPKDKTFDELCEKLRNHFIPKISVFRQRTIFYAARQKDQYGCSESITKYYARLKQLSMDCKFDPTCLNQILLDQFVTGLDQGPILERLCEEKETLTLDTAFEIAVNVESALQNLATNLNPDTNTFNNPGDDTEQEPQKAPKRRRGRGRGGKGQTNKETTEQPGEEVQSEHGSSVNEE